MNKPLKLLNKNFILLWQGQFVSAIGSQVALIALTLWIKVNTDSASVVGLSMMTYALVSTLVSPFAGTLADNISRKKIIILSDLFAGILTIVLAGMLLMRVTDTVLIIVFIMVYNFSLGLFDAFRNPSVAALLPDLVPPDRLTQANSMTNTAMQLAVLGGQSISGLLFKLLGAPLLMLIDGITYLFSALSEVFIEAPGKTKNEKSKNPEQLTVKKFFIDFIKGLTYVFGNKGLRNIILGFALMNFFLAPFLVLLPFFVEDYLKLPLFWYGVLLAGLSAGMLLGIISASFIKIRSEIRGVAVGILMLIFAAITGIVVLFQDIVPVMVGTVVAGGIVGYYNTVFHTILMGSTPSQFRGRVFGFAFTISGGLMPLGMGLTGIIADLLDKNVPLICASSSVILFILCAFLFFNRDSIKFFAFDPSDEDRRSSSIEK